MEGPRCLWAPGEPNSDTQERFDQPPGGVPSHYVTQQGAENAGKARASGGYRWGRPTKRPTGLLVQFRGFKLGSHIPPPAPIHLQYRERAGMAYPGGKKAIAQQIELAQPPRRLTWGAQAVQNGR